MWVNDRETIRYLSTRFWMPQSITDTTDFLNHAMSAGPNGAYFIVADLMDESYLGQLDLFSINWRLRSAEMGMGYAAARQTGYADQPAANAGYAPRQAEFAAAPRQNAAFGLGAQANAYRQPTETEYPQEQNTAYVAGARPENVPQRRRTAAYNL